ncbi:MAG: hypothetical protein J3K34DRAFT_435184 [Monoraphidium minutum]|nr:MAG: hypothetical protein J3K34DRAFT_435184 [Monoraphidium minutum]
MGRSRLGALLLLLALASSPADAWLDDVLTFSKVPYVQPGCDVMFNPGAWCFPDPAPFVQSCCTPGFACLKDAKSMFGHSCQQLPAAAMNYTFSDAGECGSKVAPGGQCGGGGGECKKWNMCANTGPWNSFCCPDGFTCQPESQNFRTWSCRADVSDRPTVDESGELLQYPPRALPADACTCRTNADEERVPTSCPSPWSTPAGTKQVPQPIRVGKGGRFVSTETGGDVVLRGINWYGWSVGQFNVDGLWAFCDDNFTDSSPPCQQDGEIPPHFPFPAIGPEGIEKLGGIKFWGKRTMTNDFATVVYRMKLLGFNTIRLPFSFADLNADIPAPSTGKTEFFPCMVDSDAFIALNKTLDPVLARKLPRGGAGADFPRYTGPQHPPPADPANPQCNLPWSAKFDPAYKNGQGQLDLTMCNWYMPQGPNVPAIQRLLWQVQHIVSQGMYVVLAFSSARDPEPNVASPRLFTKNWQNLYRAMADLPNYKSLKGRVLADLASDPSRWGCQWDKTCTANGGAAPSCAPGVWLYAAAASGIHAVDPDVPVLVEGMGQDAQRGKYSGCSTGSFPGLKWGDGFITNGPTVDRYNLSDPSGLFAYEEFKKIGPFAINKHSMPNQVVLSPHLYPSSITGVPEETEDQDEEVTWKWDLSWGWKSLGKDKTSSGERLRDVGLLVGEFGASDNGDNGVSNADTTSYAPKERAWLANLGRYMNGLSWQNGPASWMWWSWNANSGDTKGIVGPLTTWREVQWTKVRMLTRLYGLVPWYCKHLEQGADFCAEVKW